MSSPTDIADSIRRIIEPECVAVIGASEDTSKYGGRVIDHLVRHGFTGRIIPISTTRDMMFGLPTKRSVLEAGCEIDVALLAVPEHALEQTIADCIEAKVRCSVIIASGLGERDEAGKRRQADLVRAARRGGMRILGPNCLGFVSTYCNLAMTPSFMLSSMFPPQGGVALLSQSGALMATMLGRGADNGIGFRVCVSFGNQSDLTIEEFLEHLVDDAKTSVVAIYAEEIKDTARFFAASERARLNGKYVIVCKAGSSEAGRGTALSHTASIAGDHTAFRAVCERHQVLLTDDPNIASACAAAVARWGIARGRRTAVVSGSGGGVAITSDFMTARGFEVPALTPATTERLRTYYDTFSGYAAFDYGALPATMKGREAWVRALGDILAALVADPNVDAVVYVMTAQPQMVAVAELVCAYAAQSPKPVLLALTAGQAADHVRRRLRETGRVFADNLHDVAATLDVLSQPRVDEADLLPRPAHASDEPALRAAAGGADAAARAILRDLGIRMPEEARVASLDEALKAGDALGYPLVLKAVCTGLVHKSEAGLVKLGIADARSLRERWSELDRSAQDPAVRDQVSGRIAQQQLRGGVEIFVGTRWLPGLGAIVVVGFGGTLVELVKDVAVVAAPISPAGAQRVLRGLRLWPLLAGFRGSPAMDVRAAARAISGISEFAARAGGALQELDVNPLIVFKDGAGVAAVDCRAAVAMTRTEETTP